MQTTHKRYDSRDLIAVLMKVVLSAFDPVGGNTAFEAALSALIWRVLLGA